MKKIKLFIVISLCITDSKIYAQNSIDKTYGFNDPITGLTMDGEPIVDYSVCKALPNDPDGAVYIAVSSFMDNCEGFDEYQMRVLAFDNNGNLVRQNVICTEMALSIVATDIMPLKNNSGYIIAGYQDPLSVSQPMHPFAFQIDPTFNIIKTQFFPINGMFSRVDQYSANSEIIFVGYEGDTIDYACQKNGLIVRMNNSISWLNAMKIPTGYFQISFTNINDIKCISNSEILISGSLMDPNTNYIKTSLMKINHINGVIIWQNNQVGESLTGAKMETDNDNIYVMVNGENPVTSGLLKYDFMGNFIGGANIEVINENFCIFDHLNLHIPYFQNIKCIGEDTIMLTGKMITNTEFPFDLKIDASYSNPNSWAIFDAHFNITHYTSPNNGIIGYHAFSTGNLGGNLSQLLIMPTYSTNNTIWLGSNNTSVTTTYTHVPNFTPSDIFKTWTYNNSYSTAYGFNHPTFYNAGEIIPNSNVNFNLLTFTTQIFDEYFTTEDLVKYPILCPDRGDCCN